MHDQAKEVEVFAQRVFGRGDGLGDVVPVGYKPNWKDRPSACRMYPPHLPRIPLTGLEQLHQTYRSLVDAAKHDPSLSTLSFSQLSVLLYLTIGLLRRKLDLNWNSPPAATNFVNQEYARGSASGGGLYPVQIFVVVGAGQELKPGIYHYSNPEHALISLRHGDWTAHIAKATAEPAGTPRRYPYYLLFGVDFWMNCFKYHNFGYHVCSEDVGVTLATTDIFSDAIGLPHRNLVTFDDAALNRLIGFDGRSECVFAVTQLGLPLPDGNNAALPDEQAPLPPVQKPWQRSARVSIPAEFQRVHELALLDGTLAVPDALPASGPPPSKLERVVERELPSVLVARRSAWNSMHSDRLIEAPQLDELLRFVSRRWTRIATRESLFPDSLSLALRVNRVAGYAPGAYVWNARSERLEEKASLDLSVWQSTYAMQNYNIDQTGCILFVVGRLRPLLEFYGPRGYRIINSYVGMTAQLTYVASAALGLDCGAVLGVRALHVKKTLLLEPEQNVFLAVYLSQKQTPAELFRFQIVQDVPLWNPAN